MALFDKEGCGRSGPDVIAPFAEVVELKPPTVRKTLLIRHDRQVIRSKLSDPAAGLITGQAG